jgi:hypothetical protein
MLFSLYKYTSRWLGTIIAKEGTMKKLVLLCLFTAIIGGSIFAQSNIPTTTIKGALGLSNGKISVVSGNITYYVRGLERHVGFIDGLKEGAQVSLDGYASAPKIEGQKERLFYPVKLTLNGKNYEVGSPDTNKLTHKRNVRGPGSHKKGR